MCWRAMENDLNSMKSFSLMKTILVSFLLLFYLSSYCQTKEEIIKNIKQQFLLINSDKTLKKIVLENEEFLEDIPDGGCELKGFYKNDSIVKIVEWIKFSYGNRTREYYFNMGILFFTFEKFESFIETKDATLDHSKIKTTFEGRYYFNKTKIIDRKISGKRTFEENSKNISKQLQEEANNDLKLLHKKIAGK